MELLQRLQATCTKILLLQGNREPWDLYGALDRVTHLVGDVLSHGIKTGCPRLGSLDNHVDIGLGLTKSDLRIRLLEKDITAIIRLSDERGVLSSQYLEWAFLSQPALKISFLTVLDELFAKKLNILPAAVRKIMADTPIKAVLSVNPASIHESDASVIPELPRMCLTFQAEPLPLAEVECSPDGVLRTSTPVEHLVECNMNQMSCVQQMVPDVVASTAKKLPRRKRHHLEKDVDQSTAELERENAHFHISEALIAALEQMKCNASSDFEERHLPQPLPPKGILSDGRTDSTTTATDVSVSPQETSYEVEEGQSDSLLSSEDEQTGDTRSQQSVIPCDSHSLSQGTEVNPASAEAVALALLQNFRDIPMPSGLKDIQWLVSEQDAPQALLPLPTSYPVSPDGTEYPPLLRGTSDWAPPRPQIILSILPKPKWKDMLTKQRLRCAGCGLKVHPSHGKQLLFCSYLHRLFCSSCHENKKSLIPARIIHRWDFHRYPVSNFALDFLVSIEEEPLFPLEDINPELVQRNWNLKTVAHLRLQLFHLKDFILTCRFAVSLSLPFVLEGLPAHLYKDPGLYSLEDMKKIHKKELAKTLQPVIDKLQAHIHDCAVRQRMRWFVLVPVDGRPHVLKRHLQAAVDELVLLVPVDDRLHVLKRHLQAAVDEMVLPVDDRLHVLKRHLQAAVDELVLLGASR
ncbi:unnamed protein product [Darwinula stevensoni]|uniref:Rubicon Homology domain-containing protein n=2 Tax=Darwinula stevensoni TaxID=69355 RepID=A0A7R9FQ41_9CRUS|nr:unnamed protein product [Darwinula stevensoni]CAG0899047.1 unnamed protein product [Darwinula stevensoni]